MHVAPATVRNVIDKLILTVTLQQQCVVIHFLHLHGMAGIEIHHQLCGTCGDGVMDVKNVQKYKDD